MFSSWCYVSPRDDGCILVGSTLEFVGFHPGVTAGAVRDLLIPAVKVVPVLEIVAFIVADTTPPIDITPFAATRIVPLQ